MPTFFVLVNSELSFDLEIIDKIKDILSAEKDVKYEIQGVYGNYDIVLKVASNDAHLLRKIITTKIRKIHKIQTTLTMMVIEEQE